MEENICNVSEAGNSIFNFFRQLQSNTNGPNFIFSFKLTLENKKFKEIEEIENSGFFLL